MNIGAWLRGLGLERYERAFQEGAIDAEVLPELTDKHLRELGLPLGHRLKLLKAIAALRDGPAQPPESPSGAAAPDGEAPAAGPAPQAERRQLTVMFCDLVGSTALSVRLDPEDLREVIGAYHRCAAEVIRRFEGHLAKYLGDGVLAYFGYPQAHEDDAERAVRAGLALVEAVGALGSRHGPALRVRVGIATGLVVAGDLLGEGAAREEAVVGETPNLAARLQALADAGSVVIGPTTRRLVGGLFNIEDLGAHALKGFGEPVRAWRVLGLSAAEGRFEARQEAAGPTPLVGREGELALLLDRWRHAQGGEGQVVLLSGEPGIGKSRLVRALRERLADEPHTWLRYQCSPYHVSSALHPVIAQLERAAGFERDDPAGARLAKLEALLARGTADVAAVAPLIADLLSIPAGERYPPLDLTPQRRKERLFAALLDQLEGLAAGQPVLEVFEDAHWLDPTTEELLGLAVERVRTLPVLLVVTFRPEFRLRWACHAHATLLTLNRLGHHEVVALAERVAGGKGLPAEVVEQIVLRTDGVPLFVEELTKAVLESGLLRDEGDRYRLRGPLAPSAIPNSLRDSLMARLDRSAQAKAVAQVAAAIGREFGHALLAAVAPLGKDELADALEQLIDGELVFRRGTPPEATYTFKHALVQDVAYDSLLRSKRQRLHARVAQVLEAQFPETAEAEPELLARHCTEAGLVDKAVGYRLRAGRRAIARSATAEAIAQLRRGLEALARLPDGRERRRRELDLEVALGGALIAARGYAAEETGRAFARARELCREEGDVQRLMPVLNGQVLFHVMRAELHAAHATAEKMLELARRTGRGEATLLIPAHRALGLTSLQLGRFAAARQHAEKVLALYDPARHRSLVALYTFDQRVVALSYLHSALFALGYPDQARGLGIEQLAEARELAHPSTLAHALHFACTLRRHAGDAEGLREATEALLAVATEHGLSHHSATGKLNHGWVSIQQGRAEEGIAEIRQALAALRTAGERLLLANMSGLLVDAYISAGRCPEALSCQAEARAWAGRDGVSWFEAEQHRRDGRVLLSLPQPDHGGAEACFRRAMAVAREQDAKMWELRAATSLARLWRDQGRRAEARDLLAPIYGWFTEGFDMADTKDAQTLLDDLR